MAFIGDHSVAIGIFHDNRVSLDRLFPGGIVPPTYGYAYTQAAYDLITPDETLYYVIYSTASGEAIHATLELSQAEYDTMSSHVADTLYIIMDGTDIEDVRIGDTQADKLYLGSTALWPTVAPVPAWWPNDTSYQTMFANDRIDKSAYWVDFAVYRDNGVYLVRMQFQNTTTAASIMRYSGSNWWWIKADGQPAFNHNGIKYHWNGSAWTGYSFFRNWGTYAHYENGTELMEHDGTLNYYVVATSISSVTVTT